MHNETDEELLREMYGVAPAAPRISTVDSGLAEDCFSTVGYGKGLFEGLYESVKQFDRYAHDPRLHLLSEDGKTFKFRRFYSDSSRVTKSRPDLFPATALALAGEVLAFGESKHPDQKWKTMTVDDHLGAAIRHYCEHQAGNTLDSESGKKHIVHSLVRLAMAVAVDANGGNA